jgi:hypothetical protein
MKKITFRSVKVGSLDKTKLEKDDGMDLSFASDANANLIANPRSAAPLSMTPSANILMKASFFSFILFSLLVSGLCKFKYLYFLVYHCRRIVASFVKIVVTISTMFGTLVLFFWQLYETG